METGSIRLLVKDKRSRKSRGKDFFLIDLKKTINELSLITTKILALI